MGTGRAPVKLAPCVTDEDTPLLHISDHPADTWTLRDAYEGVQVFGGTGAGKTSGSGQALAESFLRAGMGGIVLCAKPDEADNWLRYGQKTGRLKDMIRFDESGQWRFNFLEYEMNSSPTDADIMSVNVVNALLNVLEVASRGTGLSAASGGGDPFWQKAPKMFLGYAVDLLYATTGRVRLSEIADLITSAPTSPKQMQDEDWKKQSFFAQVFREFYATGGGKFPPSLEDANRLKNFWTQQFPNIPDKTRGNVIMTIMTDLDPLLRGRLRKIFSTETNIVPEFTHDGKIILLDFPVKKRNEAGILAQQIFKFLWQRSTERRRVTDHTRPVFAWMDECQFFLSSYDMEFQSTARSSRACTVMLTQNLPTFYSRIGGNMPEHTVNALIGNLRTKIFHSNGDMTTNRWASEMIGTEIVMRKTDGVTDGTSSGYGRSDSGSYGESKSHNWSTSIGPNGEMTTSTGGSRGESWNVSSSSSYNSGTSRSRSISFAEQRESAVQPEDFGKNLLTGGWRNRLTVSGVIIQSGRIFARNRKNWMHVYFKQR